MANALHNTLLGQLPPPDFEVLQPHLQLVSLTHGRRLYAAGDPIHRVHFPVTALVALSHELPNGLRIDTALLGREDMLGVRGIINEPILHNVHVAASGLAYEMPLPVIQAAARERPPIYRMCMNAGNAILRRISAEAACVHFHRIDQRLARWLLCRDDQLGGQAIRATHQEMADSLGVRREAITLTLPKMGVVRPKAGYIALSDRALLKRLTCDCYFSLNEPSAHTHDPQE